MVVLFCSNRPLGRAENITALWDAWDGEKRFSKLDSGGSKDVKHAEGHFSLVVTDEFTPPVEGKKTTKVIMVTHGIAGGKTYGLDQPYPYISRQQALDYVIAPGEKMRGLMAQQCGVSIENVLPLGMPRTDAYFTDDVFGLFHDGKLAKRVYLYAPTYRNRMEQPYPDIDFSLLDDLLTDGEILLVKRHMVGGISKAKGYRRIVDVSAYEPTTPYLLACDALITDYSSIMFDAHIANKPVVLFTKENDRYIDGRGMYFDYPSFYSSRHATDEYELVRMLRAADKPMGIDRKCRATVAGMCDGQSTQRVIEFMRGLL